MPIVDMTQITHDLQATLTRAMNAKIKEIVARIISDAQRQVHVELMACAAEYALNVIEIVHPHHLEREVRVVFEVRTPGETA